MVKQKDLPKPELDLPLPEKELPASEPVAVTKPIWKSKFLWTFVLASTLLAFLVGGLTLGKNQTNITPSPTPTKQADETASWKSYEADGFSFKIPGDWEISPNDPGEDLHLNGKGGIYIVVTKEEDMTLAKAEDLAKENIKSGLKQRIIEVDNYSGVDYYGCVNSEACELIHYTLIDFNKNIYKFEYINTNNSKIFDGIISTIKFSKFPDSWQTYTNKNFGFTITFPKTSMNYKCEDTIPRKYYETPLEVFEDGPRNTIYISTDLFTEINNSDFKNCTVVKNSLDLIKNGYPYGNSYAGHPEPSFPALFKISYRTAINDDDLTELLHSMYGPKTYITTRTRNLDMPGVENIKFSSTDTYAGGHEPNFAYYFYYNTKNKTAIITEGFQSMVFGNKPGTIPLGFPNEYSIKFIQ